MILTKEQKTINKRNRTKARKHFGITGKPELVLHHIDENLRHTNIERYIEWRPEDLVVMTREDHVKHHHCGTKHSEETKKKIAEAHLGMRPTDETRKKLSESHKGKPANIKGRHRVYRPDGTYYYEK